MYNVYILCTMYIKPTFLYGRVSVWEGGGGGGNCIKNCDNSGLLANLTGLEGETRFRLQIPRLSFFSAWVLGFLGFFLYLYVYMQKCHLNKKCIAFKCRIDG